MELSDLLLEMRRVSVMRGEAMVLKEFSLAIAAGERVAILGPNGCGKSTLIHTISRQLYPQPLPESSMKILGRERWDVSELRRMIGLVNNDLLRGLRRRVTARELVLGGFFSSLGLWPHHEVTAELEARAAEALEIMGATHLAEREVHELSSGEERRVVIARALIHKPQALLLDEPSTSLDIGAQRELRASVRRLAQMGVGLILVTHHLPDLVPEIDRLILMRAGKIVGDGEVRSMLTEERLTELFGLPVRLAENEGLYHMWC